MLCIHSHSPRCHCLCLSQGIVTPLNDYSDVVPFNQVEYYHNCDICPAQCLITDWTNQQQVELCQLDLLPDLNQSHPFVHDTLVQWVSDLVTNYSIDGLRIDTVPEVHPDFWVDFQNSAGIYAVGEVFNGEVAYVAPYQQVIDGILSYPLFFVMRDVFANKGSMYQLRTINQQYQSSFENINLLGTFLGWWGGKCTACGICDDLLILCPVLCLYLYHQRITIIPVSSISIPM